jgi:hypothetical protein
MQFLNFFLKYNNTLCGIFYDDVSVELYRAVGAILGDYSEMAGNNMFTLSVYITAIT